MAAAFSAGEGGSTRLLWFRLVLYTLILGIATQVVVFALQMRTMVLGRVPLGWPLTAAYYLTSVIDTSGDVIINTRSHFEIAVGGLLADVGLATAAYLLVVIGLRVAWVLMKPKPRTLGDL